MAAVVLLAAIALVAVTAGGALPPLTADESPDRPDDPTTEDTVGYVEGYWYDDELPVDDRDNAAVEDDELEAVVYRSMARVEKIRGLTFEEPVSVDVISREEFQSDRDVFVDPSESQQRKQNVTYEALFMVDNETDASAELEAMYGGTVEGYYEPSTDEIVIVSDNPERPELDEIVLGHELTHALQDQRFDLSNYQRATIDQEAAENGLIEGDAVSVEREYDQRCGAEWQCLPEDGSGGAVPSNWGIYLMLYQPYSDGPEYVDHLRESGDGWDAVDAAYDDPPASSATVIHHEERDPVNVSVEDRSNDSWRPLEIDGTAATETVGEAAMVAMFADGAFESRPSVIGPEALLDGSTSYDYDQPYTDGWAGDELAVYVEDADANGTAADTGYVWETEWRSAEDAREFADGYLELLEINGAESVDDRRDTYVIDDDYPGAYYLERDGESVTIVRAPSVADLEGIAAGAAPNGSDSVEGGTVDLEVEENESTGDGESTDGNGSATDEETDTIPGFAAPGAGAAVVIALLAARARSASDRDGQSDAASRPDSATAASPVSAPSGPAAGVDGADDSDDAAADRGRV